MNSGSTIYIAGSTIYIAGAGPVGLAAGYSAQLLGAALVIVGDLIPERADRLGKDAIARYVDRVEVERFVPAIISTRPDRGPGLGSHRYVYRPLVTVIAAAQTKGEQRAPGERRTGHDCEGYVQEDHEVHESRPTMAAQVVTLTWPADQQH